MRARNLCQTLVCVLSSWFSLFADDDALFTAPLNVSPPPIQSDRSVRYDYDIVYVRAQRAGDKVHKRFYADFSHPITMEPGADLMVLHPDGSEELLVEGGNGAITDPVVSFDGQWVYFVRIYNLVNASQWAPPAEGADIYKIHLPSRKIVRLTNQQFTPNTGAASWTANYRSNRKESDSQKTYFEYGVYNMGPYPLPGGRIVFCSNRDGFRPSRGYPAVALQLFVMDDRDEDLPVDEAHPANLEKIGHLNIAGALHPVVLRDGRIMFSSLETQGIRNTLAWGIWTIHPDGTNWAPLVSAFGVINGSNGFHFQTQLSDGSIVVDAYYNQNNSGFGAYLRMPPTPPDGYPPFGPGFIGDPRNKPWRFGRFENGKGKWFRMPFMPTGSESFTPFALNQEGPADFSILNDRTSPRVGKFTHPSGAPDNHMLTVWSPGPVNHQYTFLPQVDGGIYLIKEGKVLNEPAAMRLIKNDPAYNECWPRAVVPYERIYGQLEPHELPRLVNDGSTSAHLPAGTPYGLIGTASLYKRESYPNGLVPPNGVTATYAGGNDPWKGLDPFTTHGHNMPLNWHVQGADAGLYDNSEIHAIRILAMEPTTDRSRGPRSGRLFFSHAQERLRVLGEIPVRKFETSTSAELTVDGQPRDPDGNPDTSFLAKIPADVAFTFQTIDRDGLVLNSSQTWHQLRPGEIRHNCGGCHAHSQSPTNFAETAAARADYSVFDLTKSTPLVTTKARDTFGRRWDTADTTGLREAKEAIVTVEYHRDIRPILNRSCVSCHTRTGSSPAGNLVLDDETLVQAEPHGSFTGTYYRLALDEQAKFGHRPVGYSTWGGSQASRYVRKLQSRRSLLIWKVLGRRLDGFDNDDHPSESEPGSGDLVLRGKSVDVDKYRSDFDLDYVGSIMPPPDAVERGTVAALTDEDRRLLALWIDLGCPIDLDFRPSKPQSRGEGWMLDDQRPTLAVELPLVGQSAKLDRILVGMDDFYTGLEASSLQVKSSVPLDGIPAGENLARKFKPVGPGVWQWQLDHPIDRLAAARISVSVRDREGNTTRVDRTFSVGK